MGTRISFSDFLASVSETYKSIDLRTVAGNVSGRWHNLVTVVRLSGAAADLCTQKVQEEWSKHELVDFERLRIMQTCLPLTDLDEVMSGFESEELPFYDITVSLGRSVKLRGVTGYINRHGNFVECSEWPTFEGNESWSPDPTNQSLVSTTQTLRYFVQSEEVRRWIDTRGYRSFKEALHLFLGSRPETEPSYCSDVYVSAPVSARIHSALIHPSDGKLTVTFRSHPALINSLRIHGSTLDRYNKSERFRFAVRPGSKDGEQTAEASYPSKEMEGQVGARIVHEQLGEVDAESWRVREIVPQLELNPLWHVLRSFCRPEEFEKLLCEPASLPDDQPRPQRLFEKHVAWLLACYGFASIALGSHEYLQYPGTKVRRGSLDIASFHPDSRILLLASCTMNPPQEADYSNLFNVRALLLKQVDSNVTFKTSLAIFTAAAACGPLQRFDTNDLLVHLDPIRVIDAPSMQAAVRGLQETKQDVFLQQLIGP